MNSGNSDMLLQFAKRLGFLDVEAACCLTGLQRGTAIKRLATLTALGHLRKFPYLHPRCYWGPKPLGVQALIYAASLAYRCIQAEGRIWAPERKEGPATVIESGGERETLFIDFGAEPRTLARKLSGWENADNLPLCLVVPSEGKAHSVARYIDDVRYVVFPDLWRLQCAKGPR